MEAIRLTDTENYEKNIESLLTINDNWNLNDDELFKLTKGLEFLDNFKVYKYNPLITNEVEFKEENGNMICYVKGSAVGNVKQGKITHLKNVLANNDIKEMVCEIFPTAHKTFADWEIDEDDEDYEYAKPYESDELGEIFLLTRPGWFTARVDIFMNGEENPLLVNEGKIIEHFKQVKVIGRRIPANELETYKKIKIGDKVDLVIDYDKDPAILTFYNGIQIGCLGTTRQDELKKYATNNKYKIESNVNVVYWDEEDLFTIKIDIKVKENDIK